MWPEHTRKQEQAANTRRAAPAGPRQPAIEEENGQAAETPTAAAAEGAGAAPPCKGRT